jgi:NADP-dependent 3-hydroxy acid dehydrogenase YdfG
MNGINKDVMILTGAGQIGLAIARRIGYGKKIVIGDKKRENVQAISKIMNDAMQALMLGEWKWIFLPVTQSKT